MARPSWPVRTKGEVIHVSRRKDWLWIGFGIAAVAAGAAALWLGWPRVSSSLVLVSGIVTWVGWSEILSSPRLVLGSDCIQEWQGRKTIIAHIPFANIAKILLVQHGPEFLGINLHDIADPHSYCKRSAFGSLKLHHGFDHVIADSYVVPAQEVYDRILSKYDAFVADSGSRTS
jgi:hypothetical protein